MVEETVIQSVIKEGAFAALFIWLLYTTQKKADDRESRLMTHLDRTSETLTEISDSLRDLKQEVDEIKVRVGD